MKIIHGTDGSFIQCAVYLACSMGGTSTDGGYVLKYGSVGVLPESTRYVHISRIHVC